MNTKSVSQKLILCTLTGLVIGAGFLRIGNKFFKAFMPVEIVLGLAILMLVASIVFAFVWQHREKRYAINAVTTRAMWIGLMRYAVALDLATFGFQKIFHLQFLTPLGMLDESFSSFSGEWLTWSYFGHSYAFICVIGGLQIIGSFMLLFSRTRLLGLMVILPILLNIMLIDFFYGLAPGVLAHATFMTMAAIYILLLDYDRLVLFFLKYLNPETSAPIQNIRLKNVGRFSVLFVPLILIAFNPAPNKHPQFTGKYTVATMQVNGKTMMPTTCQDSLLTVVYLDLEDECVFEFNGLKRRMFGFYKLDDQGDQVTISWHYPPTAKDKFNGTMKYVEGNVELRGKIGNDSLAVKLTKQVK